MKFNREDTALLLIDFQQGFNEHSAWGGNRNNLNAEKNAMQILAKCRKLQFPIFHIRHSSQNPNSKLHETNLGFQFMEQLLPQKQETVLSKKVNSAFIGTGLHEMLKKQKIKTLIFVGLTTNHCISTSVRMSGNYGYNTVLISDACATFDRKGVNGELFSAEIIHQTTLANLNEEFATILNTTSLLTSLDFKI